MPTFELEMNGKSYDVEAPSMDHFLEVYQGQNGGQPPEGDFFHPIKPAAGSGWGGVLNRLTQYPRIAVGELLDAGHTLGRVASGEIDAASPEAIGAAQTAVQVANPASPAYRTGTQIARKAFSPGSENPIFNPISEPSVTGLQSATVIGRQPFMPEGAPLPGNFNPGQQAAATAADIGAPLPAGIVSSSPGTQAFTQGFRQVPFVGPTITHKVGETVKAAGEKVGDIAEELSGGFVGDRRSVGAVTRNALQDVIDQNNDKISDLYGDLRQNHIIPQQYGKLPETGAILKQIKADRQKAGMDQSVGLQDIEKLLKSGRGFDGLVRARAEVGKQVRLSANNPNPGFNAGDYKRLYGAMTRDMDSVVRSSARTTSSPDQASAAFQLANSTAEDLIKKNANIQKLLNNTSDEGMLGNILSKGRGAPADTRLLGEIRGQLPTEDYNRLSGIFLHELGHTEQGFSLNKFSRAWKEKISDSAKQTLFTEPAHRKALDDIADLGSFLKDADKYRNTSNTAHGAGVAGTIVGLGHLASQASEGEWKSILGELAGLAGGYGISRILGRPVTASSLRRWLETARDVQIGRWGPASSIKSRVALSNATRNLVTNLQGMKDLITPSGTGASSDNQTPAREPLRVTVPVGNKLQDRVPRIQ